MKYASSSRQGGFGHLGIILALVVLVAVGGAGYAVWSKQHKSDSTVSTANKALQDVIKNAKCDYNDKNLCKFFTSWKAQGYYTVNATSESDGKTSTTFMQSEGTDKSYFKMTGAVTYEVIGIGTDTYTKAPNGTWWKQTTKNDTAKQFEDTTKVSLSEPSTSETTTDKTTYKFIAKEKCGTFTCFKYQEINSGTTGTSYLWFDDADYQLRRMQTNSNGSTYDATYSYAKVSIKVPSPVKTLAQNQYLTPGQNEPITLPSAGDGTPTPEELQKYLNQYQQ